MIIFRDRVTAAGFRGRVGNTNKTPTERFRVAIRAFMLLSLVAISGSDMTQQTAADFDSSLFEAQSGQPFTSQPKY